MPEISKGEFGQAMPSDSSQSRHSFTTKTGRNRKSFIMNPFRQSGTPSYDDLAIVKEKQQEHGLKNVRQADFTP